MRLIRLDQRPTGLSEDIRAALASMGRSALATGGVALVGIEAPGGGKVEAVMILPTGVLIILGVTLPAPAVRLQAPLDGRWTADGWPLEDTGEPLNPAVNALRIAEHLTEHLRQLHPAGRLAPFGTVLAVGPYVETVEQPAEEQAGPVRVIHPRATSMLAATVSLTYDDAAVSIETARDFIAALAPGGQRPSDDELSAEGFAPTSPPPLPQDRPRTQQAPQEPPWQPRETTRDRPPDPGHSGTSHTVRWIPIAALTLLGCLLVTAIVVAAVSANGSPAATTQQAGPPSDTAGPATRVHNIAFTAHASATGPHCAQHAFGDVRAELAEGGCLLLRRGSFTAPVRGRTTVTTVAVIGFENVRRAESFKDLVDTPGTGGIRDLAAESGSWPGPRPTFANAAYAGTIDGATVRVVRTDWVTGPSEPTAPDLTRVANAALDLPLPD